MIPPITGFVAQPTIQDPKSIAVLERPPSVLPNIFSFLTAKERENTRLTCKKWDSLTPHSSLKPPAIENGYGDFLLIDTTGAEVDKSTFQKAFVYMNQYLPQVHQKPLKNRLQKVNNCIKQIDPKLQVVFIPRVLYELYYILGAAQEELDLTSKSTLGCSSKKNDICWHNYEFSTWTDTHNLDPEVVELAYRLNHLIIKDLHVTTLGLTETQCMQAGRSILERYEKISEEYDAQHEKGTLFSNMNDNATIMENLEKMMIDPINLDKAISLECSKDAENTLILYRGSRYIKEPVYEIDKQPYSVCFGTSLFAGFMKDTNACANVRMFYDLQTKCRYAVSIPLKQSWKDIYWVPPVNTICELNGMFEKFHARAKCVMPSPEIQKLLPAKKVIAGYFNSDALKPEVLTHLVSTLTEERLQKELTTYQDKRIEFVDVPGRPKGYA